MTIKHFDIPRGGAYTAPSAEEIALNPLMPLASSILLLEMEDVDPLGGKDVFDLD